MRTVNFNTDSFGNGAIRIGDTTRCSAVSRVQRDVDTIGWLGADLRVIGVADLRSLSETGRRRVPDRLSLYEKPLDGHERRTARNDRARSIDMHAARRDCPINHDITAELFMSYRQGEDGRIVVDETARNAYWGVMRHADARRDDLFVGSDAPPADFRNPGRPERGTRDPHLLALWDRTSGLVIPLPEHSLLLYRFWKSGMGINLYVMDEISMRIQQRNHPECFDDGSDERVIQREIDECEAELAYVIGNNINLRKNPDAYENVRGKESMQ